MEIKQKVIIAFFLALVLGKPAFSFEVIDRWNYKFQKEVVLNCQESEYFCDDLCGKKDQCIIQEKVCRDCIGSTVYLTHIFDQIGRSIVTSDEAQIEDLINLLRSNRFSAIGPSSVYNMVDGIGDKDFEKRLASLCPLIENPHPTIIFEIKEISLLLGKPKLVVCNDGENTKLFHIDPNGGVQTNF